MKPRLIINLRDITSSPREHVFPLQLPWLQEAFRHSGIRPDPEAGDGVVRANLSRSGKDILVTGEASAKALVECARCLSETSVDLKADLTQLFHPRAESARHLPEEVELTPDDFDRETFDGETVKLDGLVRELLLLELPMQTHCDDPSCAAKLASHGVTSHQPRKETSSDDGGAALDPRLAPLAGLRERLPE